MNDIQKFTNEEFGTIRTVEQDGKVMFCGKDVATALGYTNPNKALRDHTRGERFVHPLETSGGTQHVQFITEGDLYRLIASSKLPSAQKFESWVFDDVLPSIRKQGGYMTARADETAEETIARALLLAKDAMDRKEAELAELRPKAMFADAVAASDKTMLVGEFAKVLRQNGVDMGQNRLFQWLRDNGYLISRKGSSYNLPTQRSMELGLFRVKETAITHSDGHVTANLTTKILPKGQMYFLEKFCVDGVRND